MPLSAPGIVDRITMEWYIGHLDLLVTAVYEEAKRQENAISFYDAFLSVLKDPYAADVLAHPDRRS